MDTAGTDQPWRQHSGKSQVNLPQMPTDFGGNCMGVDLINPPFAPGLPPGRSLPLYFALSASDPIPNFAVKLDPPQ